MRRFEIRDFILHLRLPYQFLILSGAYLTGGILSPRMHAADFLLQFFSVHFFLFGGVTAYNSYWDKDEGPIGGLKHPPAMNVWMLWMSWMLQYIGFGIGILSGFQFSFVYAVAMVLFWMYSSPLVRLKGKPILSLVAMGTTLFCSSLLGFYAYGGEKLSWTILIGSVAVAATIISLYPLSQIYQREEDRKRGDRTFAVTFGTRGVLLLYMFMYPVSLLLLSISLWTSIHWLAGGMTVIGLLFGVWTWQAIKRMHGNVSDYEAVMNIKYFGGMALSLFLASNLVYLGYID